MKSLLIGLVIGTFSFLNTVGAHSIPIEFLDFLVDNPNATDAEIQDFINNNQALDVEWFGEDEGPSLDEELTQFLKDNPDATAEDLQPNFDQEALNNLWDNFGTEPFEAQSNQSGLSLLPNFIKLGFTHILGGWDHVLFVIALALSVAHWRRLLLVITTFTLAHSITLILAGTAIIKLSSQIVEPIIALSIAYVAITNTFLKKRYPTLQKATHQLSIVFLFGLFHGLGFAGVFETLEVNTSKLLISLLGFNLGVELGQILILSITIPLFYWIRKSGQSTLIFKTLAVIISALSLFWFLERVLF